MKRPGSNLSIVADSLGLSGKDRETLKQHASQYIKQVHRDEPDLDQKHFEERVIDYANEFIRQLGSSLFCTEQAAFVMPADRRVIVSIIAPYLIRMFFYDVVERPGDRRRKRPAGNFNAHEGSRAAKRVLTSDCRLRMRSVCIVHIDRELTVVNHNIEETIVVAQDEEIIWSSASEDSLEHSEFDPQERLGVSNYSNRSSGHAQPSPSSNSSRQLWGKERLSGGYHTARASTANIANHQRVRVEKPQDQPRVETCEPFLPRNSTTAPSSNRDRSLNHSVTGEQVNSHKIDRPEDSARQHKTPSRDMKPPAIPTVQTTPFAAADKSMPGYTSSLNFGQEKYVVSADQTAKLFRTTRAILHNLRVVMTESIEEEANPENLAKLEDKLQKLNDAIQKVDGAIRDKGKLWTAQDCK